MESLFTFGTHCALQSCHQLDYLPFKCQRCQLEYCLNHRQAKDHQCTVLQTKPSDTALGQLAKSSFQHFRCSHIECRKRELTPNQCKNCTLNFCLSHRFPHQHSCVIKQESKPKYPRPVEISQVMPSTIIMTCSTEARSTDNNKGSRSTNIASQSRLLRSH